MIKRFLNASAPNRTAERLTLLALATFWVLLAYGVLTPGTYWSPDSGYRHIQATNIHLLPTPDFSIRYPGQPLDPALRFTPFAPFLLQIRGNRVHFIYAPWFSALVAPLLTLFGVAGEPILPILGGVVSLAILARLMAQLGLTPTWSGILLGGLATPLMFYSLNLWEHTLAIAFGLGALALALPNQQGARYRYIASAALVGVAGAFREELFILVPIVGFLIIYGERRRPTALLIWVGTIVASGIAYIALNTLFTNSALPTHLSGLRLNLDSVSNLASQLLNSTVLFFFDPGYRFMGVVLLLGLGSYAFLSRQPYHPLREAAQCAILAIFALQAFFFVKQGIGDSLHGLLSGSPCVALALLPGVQESIGVKRLRLALGAIILGIILSIGIFIPPELVDTGREWGSRYGLIAYALAVPLIVNGYRGLVRRAASRLLARVHFGLAVALIVVSLLIQGQGVILVALLDKSIVYMQTSYLALEEPQVLTDWPWLSALSAPVYPAKQLFYTEPDTLHTWIAQAYAAGVRRFVFVDSRALPLDEAHLASLAPPGTALYVTGIKGFTRTLFAVHLQIEPLDGSGSQ